MSILILFTLALACDAFTIGPFPLSLDSASPVEWLPSEFITIGYSGYTIPSYESVSVYAGGTELLVVSVDTPGELVVRAPVMFQQEINPVQLHLGRFWYTAHFSVSMTLPGVDVGDLAEGSVGPPRSFEGDSPSSPDTARRRRRAVDKAGPNSILVINCYGTNRVPGSAGWSALTPRTAIAEKTNQQDIFDELVAPWVKQASYGKQDSDHYFWEAADIAAATTAEEVQQATDRQALAQRAGDLMYDTVKAAKDAGVAVDTFDGIMINFATTFLRGQSFGRANAVQEDRPGGRTVSLKSQTNLWYVSFSAHWARRVHELSHAVMSGDLYSATGVISSGNEWDIMGWCNAQMLPSGYNMDQMLGWYTSTNIKKLTTASDYPSDNTFTVQAHGTVEDNTASVYHLIKIEVFPGLDYYVEVRQEPSSTPTQLSSQTDSLADCTTAAAYMKTHSSQQLIDFHIFDNGNSGTSTDRAGVLVTKVSTVPHEDLNQKHRLITQLGVGGLMTSPMQNVADPANNLKIEVVSQTQQRPARFRVRVFWSSAAVSDPQGLFNLRIREWSAPPYQTNDIWVDSPKNGLNTYEQPLEAITNIPTGNGDTPWVGHSNKLHAHIWNDGIADATDVQVVYYINNPPGIGDNGDWVPHATRYLNVLAGDHANVPDAPWTPLVDQHTCLRVSIANYPGETTHVDNTAHENVFHFEAAGASPRPPVYMEVSVKNPLNSRALLHLEPRHLSLKWGFVSSSPWVVLGPRGSTTLKIAVWTDIGRGLGRELSMQGKDLDPEMERGACCDSANQDCIPDVFPWECLPAQETRPTGFGFYPGKTCKELSCGLGACCSVGSSRCQQVTEANCEEFGSPYHYAENMICPQESCMGSCCLYSDNSEPGSNCVSMEPKVASTRCAPGGYYRPFEGCDTPCPELNPSIHVRGLTRAWGDARTVVGNNQAELWPEHSGDIGGISVGIASKHKAICLPIEMLDNCLRLCFQGANGATSGVQQVSVTLVDSASGATLCETLALTSTDGCTTICSPCGAPLPRDAPFRVEAESLASASLSSATCIPATFSCPSRGGLCVPTETSGCRYDSLKQRCATEACPLDRSRRCVVHERRGQSPYCACEDPPQEPPCRYNADLGQCEGFSSCPFPEVFTHQKPRLPCTLFKDAQGKPYCDCVQTPAPTSAPTAAPTRRPCRSLAGTRLVGVDSLAFLLVSWGPCPPRRICSADFNSDGRVGVEDLSLLLVVWGPC